MNFIRVDGFPSYVIHPCGTVLRLWTKSKRNPKGCSREVKPYKEKGYMRLVLYKNGKSKHFQVHRLLALAFIPNPENKRCIDHINGIRHDNRLENLRWVTYSENMNGFRSNPAQIITKGCIYKPKNRNSWRWIFYMSGKVKTKTMKNKTDLEKFRIEKLAEYKFNI